MSLGFFGATDEYLAKSDSGLRRRQISIQRQRMFTFGDALAARLVTISTYPKNIWPRAWSGTEDKALVNFASAVAKAAIGSATRKFCALVNIRRRRSDERVDIVGIGGERAIEKPARLRDGVGGLPLLSQPNLENRGPSSSEFGACSARRASAATSWALSAFARRATISSCMSKRSASGLSNRSAQR